MTVDFYGITEKFYDMWLGGGAVLSGCEGVKFIYSAERNVKQYGYPAIFDVFALATEKGMIVTYGDRAAGRIDMLENELGGRCGVNGLKAALEKIYGKKPAHSVKFVYDCLPDMPTTARALRADDIDAYVEFVRAAHPGGKVDWIYEYFDEMAADGTTFGVFADGRLVSCADAPGMPYMNDEVQEIGIATLAEYRGRGYALDACVTAARAHIENCKCPIWSAAWDNVASHGLAEKVGFRKYADAVMLSLE